MLIHEAPSIFLDELRRQFDSHVVVPLTGKSFDDAYEWYERRSDQQKRILNWLTETIQSIPASSDRPRRLLSVGCGNGLLDLPLIRGLADESNPIEYVGLDPNPVACDIFRRAFDSALPDGVTLDVRNSDIESLDDEFDYDVIMAVHSVYYFDKPGETLDRLLHRLRPGGQLLIVQAPREELNDLSQCFWPRTSEDDLWFSDRVQAHFERRQVRVRRNRLDARVDVSSCLTDEEPAGHRMMDFITQCDSRAWPETILQLCRSYLVAIRDDVKTCDDVKASDEIMLDQPVLVPHPADTFQILG